MLLYHLVAKSRISRSLAMTNGAPALNGKWIGLDSRSNLFALFAKNLRYAVPLGEAPLPCDHQSTM